MKNESSTSLPSSGIDAHPCPVDALMKAFQGGDIVDERALVAVYDAPVGHE